MEWFNDHKYNNNLVRVQFEIITLYEFNLCFRTQFSLSSTKEIQGEREMAEPVDDCKCHG